MTKGRQNLIAEDDLILADGLTRSLRQSKLAVDCINNSAQSDDKGNGRRDQCPPKKS
jgi:hypothetical protein